MVVELRELEINISMWMNLEIILTGKKARHKLIIQYTLFK